MDLKKIDKLKLANKRVVFTNGCFDILHLGHIKYLQKAKELGDILVVGLNSDISVRNLKGNKRPIFNQDERSQILLALSCVDFVIFFDEKTPLMLIKQIKPDVLVKGGDWKTEDIVGSDFVINRGGVVRSLNFEDGYSTTKTIEKILNAYG